MFEQWANQAGLVASYAQFEDIYGLDDEVRMRRPLSHTDTAVVTQSTSQS